MNLRTAIVNRIHPIAPAWHRTSTDLTPLGLSCSEHASTTVNGRCYWCLKRSDSLTAEQAAFAGWADPFTEQPAYVARHGPEWQPAVGPALEALFDDELDRFDPRAPRMGAEELATLHALMAIAPGGDQGLEEAV